MLLGHDLAVEVIFAIAMTLQTEPKDRSRYPRARGALSVFGSLCKILEACESKRWSVKVKGESWENLSQETFVRPTGYTEIQLCSDLRGGDCPR
jgi:membrane protein implicated in regulation of membrane protease activity